MDIPIVDPSNRYLVYKSNSQKVNHVQILIDRLNFYTTNRKVVAKSVRVCVCVCAQGFKKRKRVLRRFPFALRGVSLEAKQGVKPRRY
ncbi:hypothetical protein Hanom_Chr05g00436491 [Helianthus anomalus]